MCCYLCCGAVLQLATLLYNMWFVCGGLWGGGGGGGMAMGSFTSSFIASMLYIRFACLVVW